MLGRTTRRLATLALAGGAALTLQAAPALAYYEQQDMYMSEESATLCTWASETYSPGAKVLSHGGTFECQSNGTWKHIA